VASQLSFGHHPSPAFARQPIRRRSSIAKSLLAPLGRGRHRRTRRRTPAARLVARGVPRGPDPVASLS
jgi:hypothetical protein